MKSLRPIFALTFALGSAASAQNVQRFELTERLRLDAAAEDFSAFTLNRQGNAPFYIGPRREVVLPLTQDGNVRIYDSTGKRITTLGRKGEGPGEFRSIFRVGWTGDTLWIYDALIRRITFFARDYSLLKSTTLSEALRQRVEGDNPHVISDFAPSTISAGNSIGQIVEVNGRDPVTTRLLFKYFVAAVGPDGSVRKLAEIPIQAVSPRAYVPIDGPARIAYAILPFANDALYAFSVIGDRFAIVTTAPEDRTYTITVRNGGGATLFTSRIPFSPRPIPAAVADSAADAVTKNQRQTPAVITALRNETRRLIPPNYPPVKSVVLARDGTTWIRTTDSAGKDQAVILDAHGKVTGTVALRPGIDIVEADGSRVWAVDVDADGLASVVVFTLKKLSS